MAKIGEVYGENFQSQAVNDRALYAANLFATNIVNKEFNFRNDSLSMWDQHNMKPSIIEALCNQVKQHNPMFRLIHVPKTSSKINRFPYLINGDVEYFNVVDLSKIPKPVIYSIYITPSVMEAF
jgi:hypothetical protein